MRYSGHRGLIVIVLIVSLYMYIFFLCLYSSPKVTVFVFLLRTHVLKVFSPRITFIKYKNGRRKISRRFKRRRPITQPGKHEAAQMIFLSSPTSK